MSAGPWDVVRPVRLKWDSAAGLSSLVTTPVNGRHDADATRGPTLMPLRRNTIVLQCGMAKESYINARVDKQLKTQAEKVLRSLGVSTSDLITMLLRQVVLTKGVPFDVRLPNEETIRAMAELEGGGGETSTGATREILDRATRKRG